MVVPPRLTEVNYLFAKAVKSGKWQSKSIREAESLSKENAIEVRAITKKPEIGSLSRSLVGWSEVDIKEKPTLADIRIWSSAVWKNTIGLNIYEFNENRFLFEFPNKFMAEQTL